VHLNGLKEQIMSRIQVKWADEKQSIIYYSFDRVWEWGDIVTALKEGSALAASVTHRVDVIMDMSSANIVPSGAITQLRQSYSNKKASNLEVTVIVGANTFWEKLIDVTNRFAGAVSKTWKLEFAQTPAQAFSLIESLRMEALAK
jgi:hypothetical protein